MDLLKLIKSKTNYFRGTPSELGLDAVVHHIEISESHFELGKSNGEHLYTDVIYRTNQAFEGALKEAYRILTGEDPSNKSPFQIEKYFSSNSLLKDRVLAHFTTYRTEWRNKSTHNYQLFFSSQEALLAIVSVSAFFNILLDQMLEKQYFDIEKAKTEKRAKGLFGDSNIYGSLSFMQQVIELLKLFSMELKEEFEECVTLKEFELQGRFAGFISAADPEVEVLTDYPLSHSLGRFHFDMLLKKGNSHLIIELKRPQIEYQHRVKDGIEQLKHYLVASYISQGIVFVPAYVSKVKEDYQEYFIDEPSGELKIAAFTPAMLTE
ncbi:hypothetical protein J3U57_01285 [Gilliamella sp. B3464]|uniref:hypothetical protein n=1 Tax=unclassified Gilliamella TaxID=2685620 RepID=UPI00226A2039|nr:MULTISPECIES: hypothetical protein [unclassified Gilliamella]MCX8711152.1 hypothetical protein [Gilliamella sp. B3468]MCX8750202.1 hypothetical protein [Gilliamella sp. B3464]